MLLEPIDNPPARSALRRAAGRIAALLLLVLTATLLLSLPQARAQNDPTADAPAGFGNVLTQHDNNFRTGLNDIEPYLTPANVNVRTFGKLFARKVDGQIYAQPLYVSNLQMSDGTTHNVVFVATEHNSVYAFDADDPAQSAPLWTVNLGTSVRSEIIQRDFGGCVDMAPEYGITGTPVIDKDRGTIYLVAKTYEYNRYVQRVHALDITSGNEQANSPVEVQAAVPGSGGGSFLGQILFDAKIQKNTPGSAETNGVVYFSWASHCDYYFGNYHGWVLGYNADTLQLVKAFNTSPDGVADGIWQGGKGPAADENGYLYLETGNGSTDAQIGGRNYGEAFVKLNTMGSDPMMDVASWFIPHHYQTLNERDDDLGAGGPMLLPGTNLIVGGGKDGYLYVLDRMRMGGFNPTGDRFDYGAGDTQIVQKFRSGNGHLHLSPVYFNGGAAGEYVYTWQENDNLRSYRFNRGANPPMSTTPTAVGPRYLAGHPDGEMAVSSFNNSNGILWSFWHSRDANHSTVPGQLIAFDALTLRELWNSDQAPGRLDELVTYPKFCAPTVANGHVYAATFGNELDVYGVFPAGTVQPPYVQITQPSDGAAFATGSTVRVCANAFVRGESISGVEFFADGVDIGPGVLDPATGLYCIDYTPSEGNHTLTAVVTTASGATATSRAVRIRVGTVGGATRVYAVNSGGPDVPGDALAPRPFTADAFFQGGNQAGPTPDPVDRSGVDPNKVAPEAVYHTERWGNFSYTFPNLAPGSFYTVRLHFAENVFDNPGQRVFNVSINGSQVLTNFDIRAAAGAKNKAIIQEFTARANSQGQIVVTFSQGLADNPKVSGIEIIGAATAPRITMTAPGNGAVYSSPASVPVSAQVGGVTSVTFTATNNATGVVTTVGPIATYDYPVHTVSATITGLTPGTYTISATGVDTAGNTVTAVNPITITVISTTTIIDFSGGFAPPTGLQLNGNQLPRLPRIEGTRLRLTENGTGGTASTAFYTTKVNVNQFFTQFRVQFSPGFTADGLTFIIQNDPRGAMALGPSGGGLGYGADQPGVLDPNRIVNSVAVKLDLYPGKSTTGLFTNGESPKNRDVPLTNVDLHNGNPLDVTLFYNGTTLSATIRDTVTGGTDTQSYTVNIPATVGGPTAYVGFGAGTGGVTVTTDVLSWTYQQVNP